ncbi:MAG: bifunctional homocysteine S-methyltransferase/methylenetetrahydrofolate reductase [Anaerolineae bacterium]|nr:bifunctional homocysteine S-methyltransferase/methylenetetrahydrofolate reductase [Anaerolineae bacterium]
MNRTELLELLNQRGTLLADGAMGTMLHSRGAALDACFDALCLENPALVAEIHRGYIEAGADLIETNSFGANRYKLLDVGRDDELAAINAAAVTIARRVIESSYKRVLLAGSVGPLGVRLAPLGRVTREQAQAAFAEQIAVLLQPDGVAGVDLLILETMSDKMEIEVAVAAARHLSPDIPIIAQMTFARDDRTLLGDTPAAAAAYLANLDVDMIGINCSGGPAQLLRLAAIMHEIAPQLPLAVSPNAGWPERSEGGRVFYPATPDYFADYTRAFAQLGVRLVGGCCGTTPAHIAAMRRALDTPGHSTRPLPHITIFQQEESSTTTIDQPTQLAEALQHHTFIKTVEMRPPKGVSPHRLVAAAQMLKEAGANFLDIADFPLARMRMSAWAAAYLIQGKVGVETILHFPTRGRNLLRIQGDLLAAYSLNVRNLFVTMGDPARIGDYPEAMDSYDIVPTGLIQLIKQQFNAGLDQAGQKLDQPTSFVVGCAMSLQPKDPAHEIKLLQKKIQSGADFALTQPVFDPAAARQFITQYQEQTGQPMLPLIVGIQPLFNSANAEFLHNEVPGISIPEPLRQRMLQATNPQDEGVAIAQEIMHQLDGLIQGVYLIPAFGRYDLAAQVLDAVKTG